MANKRQLDVLLQGVEAWNQWINELPGGTLLDLRGADLKGEHDISFRLLPKCGSILSSFQVILEGVEPFSTKKERGK